MSECLSPSQVCKIKDAIAIDAVSPCVQRSFLDRSQVALALTVKNRFLKEIHNIKSTHDFSYIDIVNSQLSVFQICTCERLENRFSNLSNKVKTTLRKGLGSRRNTYLQETVSISVYEHELFDVRELNESVSEFSEENFQLMKKCSDLHESFQKLQDAHFEVTNENNLLQMNRNYKHKVNAFLSEQIKSTKDENEKLNNEVQYLKGEINMLNNLVECTQKHDKKLESNNVNLLKYVDELERKLIKSTKLDTNTSLRQFKSEVERALWFGESFGLIPESLACRDKKSGASHLIRFGQLKVEDKDKIRQLVYILDKFSISNCAYYELSMFDKGLPRKYMVAQERENLNKLFHIERCPGNAPGAYVSLSNEIAAHIIDQSLNPGDTLKVKVSGDGAKMSRITNFVTLSVSFPDSANCTSVHSVKTLAILKCAESYDTLKIAASPTIRELNQLISAKEITVDDSTYKLDLYFGGDMKFVDIFLGLNGPTANYACPWCHVHKSERTDLTKPMDYYESEDMKRTAENMQKNAKTNQFGCKHTMLVNIEPSNIIPDELHLLLRVSDILLKNLIDDCVQQDAKLAVKKENPHHVQDLISKINDCGVLFNIWTEKGSNNLNWTSLTGNDYKRLHQKLPYNLLFVIANDTHDEVVKLWHGFYEIYNNITGDKISMKKEELFRMANDWGNLFLSVGKCGRLGYDKITPYMHCLIYHVPTFVDVNGSLAKFSGQAIEKLNDEIKLTHMKRTNKTNQTVDDLTTRKRLEYLSTQNHQRTKQTYTKRNIDYWENQKQLQHSIKRTKIEAAISEANKQYEDENSTDVDDMNEKELKEILRSYGIATKVRKRNKLIQMVREAQKK